MKRLFMWPLFLVIGLPFLFFRFCIPKKVARVCKLMIATIMIMFITLVFMLFVLFGHRSEKHLEAILQPWADWAVDD